MRLSGLSVAVVLISSSLSFAQHHDVPSAPPPPPPPPPPHVEAPAPTPAPSPSPSFSNNSTPAVAPSHISEPTPSPVTSAPETHVEHTMGSVPSSVREESSAPKADAATTPDTNTERVVPAEKISGDSRILGSARVGEKPPDKESDAKPAEADLRHRICPGGSCKEPEPKPVPPDSDLRHRICLTGPCTCPSGQTMGKNGCIATTVTNESPAACGPGQSWTGSNCAQSPQQCAAGQYWNGAACVLSAAECASFNSRAAAMTSELYAHRSRVEQTCRPTPSSDECSQVKVERDGAIQRYRMLLAEAPSRCAAVFPDPSIFSADFP